MSVVFSGNMSGTFVSTGVSQFLALPAGFDTISVYNWTTRNYYFYQQGMPNGQGLITAQAGGTAQIAAGLGFWVQNTSVTTPTAGNTVTAVSNAAIPMVTTASSAGLIAGTSVVRMFNLAGALQLNGIDFTVGTVPGGAITFQLGNMAQIAATAGIPAGSFVVVPFNPYYYPSTRVITGISQAAQAVVTLSVTHTYVVGQKVRLKVTADFGMYQINDIEATIVAVGAVGVNGTTTNTITIDVNTTGFTAFAFPLTAAPGFTPAMVIPVGENMTQAMTSGTNYLADAQYNAAQTGVLLMPAVTGPAGVNADVIYWTASKSFNT
jgi:hypothetical protein